MKWNKTKQREAKNVERIRCTKHHDKIEHWIDATKKKSFVKLNGILSPLFVICIYCFILFVDFFCLISSLLIRQHDSLIYQLEEVKKEEEEEDSSCGRDNRIHKYTNNALSSIKFSNEWNKMEWNGIA